MKPLSDRSFVLYRIGATSYLLPTCRCIYLCQPCTPLRGKHISLSGSSPRDGAGSELARSHSLATKRSDRETSRHYANGHLIAGIRFKHNAYRALRCCCYLTECYDCVLCCDLRVVVGRKRSRLLLVAIKPERAHSQRLFCCVMLSLEKCACTQHTSHTKTSVCSTLAGGAAVSEATHGRHVCLCRVCYGSCVQFHSFELCTKNLKSSAHSMF